MGPGEKLFFRSFIITFTLSVIFFSSALSQRRLCGRALTDALTAICDSQYNAMSKKSAQKMDFTDSYDHSYFDEDYPYKYAIFMTKSRGGVIIPKVRRLRAGVSDECCKKPCTLKELTSYCNVSIYDQLKRS